MVARHNYEVIAVPVTGCLHLKSSVTHLGRDTLLSNRAWFDTIPLAGYECTDVDPAEPQTANPLALAATPIFPASIPPTHTPIKAPHSPATPLDLSDLKQ